MSKQSLKLWECQDCGKLEVVENEMKQPTACWCCVDMNGVYNGKNERNEFKIVQGYYKTNFKKKE